MEDTGFVVVPDIPGHTVNLVVEHCKNLRDDFESRANLHTVEVDRSLVMEGDKID